jgi:hypothetical protein
MGQLMSRHSSAQNLHRSSLEVVGKWELAYHRKTLGCLFDRCDLRADLVKGLSHMKFDHKQCRNKMKNGNLLKAIDALLALEDSL